MVALLLALAALAGAAPRGDPAEIAAARAAALAKLDEANAHADAWRALGDEAARKDAEAAYQAAEEGLENAWGLLPAETRAWDGAAYRHWSHEDLERAGNRKQLQWALLSDRAQARIFRGRLDPDPDPDPAKGNPRIEEGSALLDELAASIGAFRGHGGGRMTPPASLPYLRGVVAWQRGDPAAALRELDASIEATKGNAAYAGTRANALYAEVEVVLEKQRSEPGALAKALAAAQELSRHAGASGFEALRKRGEVQTGRILLLQGRRAEALGVARRYARDDTSAVCVGIAQSILRDAGEPIPDPQGPVSPEQPDSAPAAR